MKIIRNPETLLPLLGLLLLVCSCSGIYGERQDETLGEELLSPTTPTRFSYLPVVFSPAEYSPPSVPGFVPPDYENSPYEVMVSLPACDEDALIINEHTDLSQIDWVAHDVFCLLAGDYTAWGILDIEDVSGTADQPKVLRYYDPDDNMPPHPVVRADSSGPEAVLLQFRLKRSNHWILDGLTIRNSPENNYVTDSSWNIFNRLLIEEGDAMLLRIDQDSDGNVVQNSVLRNQSAVALQNDTACLILYTKDGYHEGIEIEDTRIVNNEIYNCNDGINLLKAPLDRPAFYPGTIVANNDIYITDKLYTDCMGNPHPEGACACSENAIDVKATIKDEDLANSDKWVRIVNNRMWGFRHTDATEDEQGNRICPSGSSGTAVRSHYGARGLLIQGNVIMDSPQGINAAGAMESDPRVTNHLIVNNLVYNIHDCYDYNKQGMKQFYLKDQEGYLGCLDEYGEITKDRAKGLATADDDNPPHYGNVHFGNTLISVGDRERDFGYWVFAQDALHTFECNAILRSDGKDYSSHETNNANKNAYYDSVPYCTTLTPCEEQHIINESTVGAAKHSPFTFLVKRWTGPEQITIPDAIATAETPRFGDDGACWIDDPDHPWN